MIIVEGFLGFNAVVGHLPLLPPQAQSRGILENSNCSGVFIISTRTQVNDFLTRIMESGSCWEQRRREMKYFMNVVLMNLT